MFSLLVCLGLSARGDLGKRPTIERKALLLSDTASMPLTADHVEHTVRAKSVGTWNRSPSLFFGNCTSGVLLRVPLEVPHPGRWWWTSELRTPEELRMRLGSRDLGVFGTSRPFSERPSGALPVSIPLDLHGGPETLFVQASDPQGDVELDVQFVPDALLPSRLQNHAARDAWVLGLTTALLLVSGYLWWTVRERAFGWYFAYIGLGILWVSTKTGFASALLWPNHPAWNHVGPSFASRASLVFFLLFLRDLLGLRKHFPRFGSILDLGIAWEAGCALFALSSLWAPAFHAGMLRHFTPEILEGPALLLGLGLVASRALRGDALAGRVVVSCLPLLLAAIFGAVWDPLHPDGSPNLDTPVAICGALLENIFTTWVLASEVRRRVRAHADLKREFDLRLERDYERYRSRIAADLHDDLSQQLMAARLALHAESNSGTVAGKAEDLLQGLADSIRSLSHHLDSSRPRSRTFQEDMRELAGSMGGERLQVRLDLQGEEELLPTASLELFRIVQETLSNAVHHGQARCVEIRIRNLSESLELAVRDDGKGIDPAEIVEGMGLRGIRARAARMGGTVQLEGGPGRGTLLRVRVPLEKIRV
jgi:two-component system sensor histidine kinase UhpB